MIVIGSPPAECFLFALQFKFMLGIESGLYKWVIHTIARGSGYRDRVMPRGKPATQGPAYSAGSQNANFIDWLLFLHQQA